MNRYGFVILFLVVLAAPFLLRPAMTLHSEPVSRGRLVVVTPHNQDIRNEYGAAFADWHQKRYGERIDIDFRVVGGTNDIKRLLENTYGRYADKDGKLPADMPADIDVVWGGGDYFFDVELRRVGAARMNVLQPLSVSESVLKEAFPTDRIAGVLLYDSRKDKDGNALPVHWVGVCLSSFGIVYNPELFRTLKLAEPKEWGDLTHQKLAGYLALADPTHSNSASVAYMMVVQRAMADAEEKLLKDKPDLAKLSRADLVKTPEHKSAIAAGWKEGQRQLLLIASNARYFSESASMVPNDVANGQAAAGVVIDFYGRVYQETLGPGRTRFIAPAAATAITPDPAAILYGVKGRQLELANRFIEFLLSREGQLLWILKPGTPGGPKQRALRRPPIRRDVYGGDRSLWTDDVDPFRDAGTFNQRQEWMGSLSDTRLVWIAAWLDARDALKETQRRIQVVKDPKRRANLLYMLSDLPVTYDEVLNLSKQMPPGSNVSEWRARTRIALAKRFRDHYEKVYDQVDAKKARKAKQKKSTPTAKE